MRRTFGVEPGSFLANFDSGGTDHVISLFRNSLG
jgi:hypothetical protein